MVNRYTFELHHCNGADMCIDKDGEYVSYEDYERLEEAYAELQEQYDLDVNPEGK